MCSLPSFSISPSMRWSTTGKGSTSRQRRENWSLLVSLSSDSWSVAHLTCMVMLLLSVMGLYKQKLVWNYDFVHLPSIGHTISSFGFHFLSFWIRSPLSNGVFLRPTTSMNYLEDGNPKIVPPRRGRMVAHFMCPVIPDEDYSPFQVCSFYCSFSQTDNSNIEAMIPLWFVIVRQNLRNWHWTSRCGWLLTTRMSPRTPNKNRRHNH